MTTQTATYRIPAANLSSLQAKIQELAQKAAKIAKKGQALADSTPIGLRVIETITVTDKDTGLPRFDAYIVEVTGSTPKINGYSLLATLQHEAAGTIIRRVPTVELAEGALDAYRTASTVCDHCATTRRRNDTYLVRHEDSGRIVQVGRSCLGDYLGADSPDALARMAQFLAQAGDLCGDAEEEGGEGSGSGGRIVEPLISFLAFTCFFVRVVGYLSRKTAEGTGRPTTGLSAWMAMHPSPRTPERDRVRPEAVDIARATVIHDHVVAHFATDANVRSDYEHSLSVVVRGGEIDSRLVGYAASLVPWYEREVEKKAAEFGARGGQGYLGTVGERATWILELRRVFDIDTDWGGLHIHSFVSPTGQTVVWKTGSHRLAAGWYQVRGTVKEHGEFGGSPQTEISRADCSPLTLEEAQARIAAPPAPAKPTKPRKPRAPKAAPAASVEASVSADAETPVAAPAPAAPESATESATAPPASGDLPLQLYTFRLIDDRLVSYGGQTESAAFNRANRYHPGAVVDVLPAANECHCPSKRAHATREAGWLICIDSRCAGRIGGWGMPVQLAAPQRAETPATP
jgi:hypothetical protein